MVLRKKEVYTIITPIPSFIPRQLAIDILHSHGEVITLNPLVLGHKQIKAPRDAAADEYFSTWYEITERVQFVPGMGRFGSGKISFNACFHDLPWGLQTHVYAPLNIDMRNKYRVAGNQPGVEPPEPPEIGLAELGVPKDGLYLREDIEIRCNIAMVATVKAQMKQASKDMIERIIKKAELLDAGILQAMIEDGRLKTYKPAAGAGRTYTAGLDEQNAAAAAARSPQPSPRLPSYGAGLPLSPTTLQYQIPRPVSSLYGHQPGSRPGTAGSYGPSHWQQMQQQQQQQMYDDNNNNNNNNNNNKPPYAQHAELPMHTQHAAPGSQAFPMELPGDFYHPQPPQQQQQQQPSSPTSSLSVGRPSPNPQHQHSPELPGQQQQQQRWSHQPHSSARDARPSSFASDPGVANRARSPAPNNNNNNNDNNSKFAAELTTHRETPEEHHGHGGGVLDNKPWATYHRPYGYSYNPADYARTGR